MVLSQNRKMKKAAVITSFAFAAAFRFEFIVFPFVLYLRIVSSELVIMTRPSCGDVCECRGGAASDNGRGLVD